MIRYLEISWVLDKSKVLRGDIEIMKTYEGAVPTMRIACGEASEFPVTISLH